MRTWTPSAPAWAPGASGWPASWRSCRGEKIDIIKYSEDPAEFIADALAPAEVLDVQVAETGKACRVRGA